ncbi:MFS general substrate transporter [Aureobasidium pullulans]|uniref:MFS general substrate transporter n=1 Tax=Aureobasidium pullulans TaxID=5580 RepID=A0A4S8YTU5_AURPU|nr:MFS general substrate transporter [Aureobasidium pullulans]
MSFRNSLEKKKLDDEAMHIESAPVVTEIESFRVLGLDPDDAEFFTNYSEADRKKTFRKVDLRLVPMLSVLYLMAHIDRANIGNAKIEGMIEDLGMTGVQYNIVLSIFFIPYVLCEVPSNILLKKFKRPSYYLGILVTSWGIIMTCTGLVRNFAGLMVMRILLGIFEARFFLAAIYLCSY